MTFYSNEQIANFCINLRHLRQSVGWTQEDLATRVGVSRQTITYIENGKKQPSVTLYLALLGLFCIGSNLSPILNSITDALKIDTSIKNLFK